MTTEASAIIAKLSSAKRAFFLDRLGWSEEHLATSALAARERRKGKRPTQQNIWSAGLAGSRFADTKRREAPQDPHYVAKAKLDSHLAYIYEIYVPALDAYYVGKRHHVPSEKFHSYMGSGWLLTQSHFLFGAMNARKQILAFVDHAEVASTLEVLTVCGYLLEGHRMLNQNCGGSSEQRMAFRDLVDEASAHLILTKDIHDFIRQTGADVSGP